MLLPDLAKEIEMKLEEKLGFYMDSDRSQTEPYSDWDSCYPTHLWVA